MGSDKCEDVALTFEGNELLRQLQNHTFSVFMVPIKSSSFNFTVKSLEQARNLGNFFPIYTLF